MKYFFTKLVTIQAKACVKYFEKAIQTPLLLNFSHLKMDQGSNF
jgi:hypothetical protein